MDSLPDPALPRSSPNIAEVCPKIPALLPTWKTCGKAGCKCGRGKPHGPYWSLRWREGGRHHRTYVRSADLEAVRTIIAQRREARFRERIEHAIGMTTWRQMARQLEAIEARIHEQGGDQ